MPVRDFVRMMAERPVEAGETLRSIGDLLLATGKRLATKADDVQRMARNRAGRRRALRIRRQAQQRMDLAAMAYAHAQDLFHRAAGNHELCSADPLRPPL
jgi:hypothetical protein